MTEYIRCTKCPVDWEVSQEDPDSTLSDAFDHVTYHHGADFHIDPAACKMIEPGVNRCRDGVHSMPHRGCILR